MQAAASLKRAGIRGADPFYDWRFLFAPFAESGETRAGAHGTSLSPPGIRTGLVPTMAGRYRAFV